MDILVIDIGGISVKLHATRETSCSFPTPPAMTPQQMLQSISELTADWRFDHVSIGFPGPVRGDKPLREPVNLGPGWVDFDFQEAFGCPARMINDAAMQALGSYRSGIMLFLGLGTGLGTALIQDEHIVPMEIAHLPFRDNKTFEQLLGNSGLESLGTTRWKERALETIDLFTYVLCPEYIVLGGGNAQRFSVGELPEHVSIGHNDDASSGGMRLWDEQ
jgi:polyphosphate glucokinase